MRHIFEHEGSRLNNIHLRSDERDEHGGAHEYEMVVVEEQQDGERRIAYSLDIHFQKGPLLEAGLNGVSMDVKTVGELKHRTDSRARRGVEGTHAV